MLKGNGVEVKWDVINTDNKEIYFSIGAHPALNIPINENNTLEDYYIMLKNSNNVYNIQLNGPFYDKIVKVENLSKVNLKPQLFINDALIYTNIDNVSIFNKDDKVVEVNLKGFPLVGIWSPYYKKTNSIAPFICIEPWYGLADSINSNGHYKDKLYINKLNENCIFSASYEISL